MRKQWRTTVLALVLMALASGAQAGEKFKILVIQGGGHNWKLHLSMLEEWLEKTGDFECTLTPDLNALKAESIQQYTAVFFYGSGLNFTDPAQEKGLCDFVRGGGVYTGAHSASDSFKKSDAYWEMLGGRFSGHGGGKFKVEIYDKEHPITQGLEDFEIQDETYCHSYHKNAQMRSLVRMRRGDERQSMGWVSQYGKGRVFYTSLGHGTEAWKNPAFQRLLVRGIYWAVGQEPKDPK
ncbi:ThuA domain-containing protein [bacterium]|nr:ThuA domain-containing protein [bacterium]